MEFSFTIEIDQEILRIEIHGAPASEAEWLSLWQDVYSTMAKNNIVLVLSDERWAAVPAKCHEAAIAAAKVSTEKPLDARFAIVTAPHSVHLYDYLVDLLDEGEMEPTRIFDDMEEAEAWLRR